MPPEVWIGSFVSETTYGWNTCWSDIALPRDGTMTSWNTSHGPAKSIMTAPWVMTNATGIEPWSGGTSFRVDGGASVAVTEYESESKRENAIVRVIGLLLIESYGAEPRSSFPRKGESI